MAFSRHFPAAVPISVPPVRLRIHFPLLVVGWMGTYGLVDFWLFHSDDVVWPAIRLYLIVVFFLLSGFMVALSFLMYYGETHRVQWLEAEARRLERGELSQAHLKRADATAQLSVAIRRMAIRIGDFWRVINEHTIGAITDGQGRITFANHKFCAISGYQREELLGNTHQMVNSGKHPAVFFQNIWKTIWSGTVWIGKIENRAKNGIPYFVATTIFPCQGTDGKSHGYVAIRTEVTASKAVEGRTRRLFQELERKNRELKTFLHALTHDLRVTSVNVQGFTEEAGRLTEDAVGLPMGTLAGTPPSKERVEALTDGMEDALRFSCAGAEKMDALLKGLEAISRLERSDFHLVPTDISTLLEERLAVIQFQLAPSDAMVTAGSLPSCLVDSSLLGRAFFNLVENPIKCRDSGRQLQLGINGSHVGTSQVAPRPGGGILFAVMLRNAVLQSANPNN